MAASVAHQGKHEHVEPHLTIAMYVSAEIARNIKYEVAKNLPISTELTEARLVSYASNWILRERFTFVANKAS